MTAKTTTQLDIVSGPIVRRFTEQQLVLWYVTNQAVSASAKLEKVATAVPASSTTKDTKQDNRTLSYTQEQISHQVGTHAFINHLVINFDNPLICGQGVDYDIEFDSAAHNINLTQMLPSLALPGLRRPRIYYQRNIKQVLHGSCRKPHHDEPDALVRVEQHLAQCAKARELPAAMLIMSGDQVYVDDVAGPFLQAIKHTIAKLGLFDEAIPGAQVSSYSELVAHPNCYYKRTELLPLGQNDEELEDSFFKAKRKPIFTSVNAKNHLITLSEVLAMYFLVWSPQLWRDVSYDDSVIPEQERETFDKEKAIIEEFVATLDTVRRAMANIPVYMIFDDHDITDDWNLTREWEELAYGHPFSQRIIGNALFGYWLCQGLGNHPNQFRSLLQEYQDCFTANGIKKQAQIIQQLFHWNNWEYDLNTSPRIVVLDTRTHRWRSENNPRKPSGLLDWERLRDLKSKVTGTDTVIIVSAAPIFGVKLIEAIQKIFTWFGQALTVDAENWMAHKGTAKVLLQIFKDKDTAGQYIILSGDVHYSFTYDIRLRFTKTNPSIHQLTASGFKNQFPVKLISKLDKLNRILYGHKSPLNWFTKRRRMNISTRYPDRKNKSLSLVSKSAVGLLEINSERKRPTAKILLHDGKDIEFK